MMFLPMRERQDDTDGLGHIAVITYLSFQYPAAFTLSTCLFYNLQRRATFLRQLAFPFSSRTVLAERPMCLVIKSNMQEWIIVLLNVLSNSNCFHLVFVISTSVSDAFIPTCIRRDGLAMIEVGNRNNSISRSPTLDKLMKLKLIQSNTVFIASRSQEFRENQSVHMYNCSHPLLVGSNTCKFVL